MRLASFEGGFGRLAGEEVVRMGDDLVEYLRHGTTREGERVLLSDLSLTTPIPSPEKVICIGLNYRDHAEESEMRPPEEPVLFTKFANSLAGPGQPVTLPPVAREVDYEAELGVVIGRMTRDVTVEHALDYVAGYTCMNDLSARDLQFRSDQWTRGKAIDAFHPTGPWLVTADEVGDPQALAIRCTVNGRTLQDSSTAEMIFTVAEIISFISETMTLYPGDLISTGTPAGVGFTREPPVLLDDGDEVVVEIERIGSLRTPIVRTTD